MNVFYSDFYTCFNRWGENEGKRGETKETWDETRLIGVKRVLGRVKPFLNQANV